MQTQPPVPARARAAARPAPVRLALVAVALLATAVLAAAIASALAPGRAAAATPRLVDPPAFAAAVARKGTVTIDVRGPGEAFIRGTDLSIAFDTLAASRAKLPAKTTQLAVYCHSGRRSAIAVQTLRKLGYRDIVELRGGVTAWLDSGRALQAVAG